MQPIFIGATRSFWAFVATVALIFGQGEPVVRAVVALVALVCAPCGIDIPTVTATLMEIAPIFTAGWVLYERRGENRPYTANPKAMK